MSFGVSQRKKEIRKRDLEDQLSPSEFKRIANTSEGSETVKDLATFDSDSLSHEEFASVRDHLLVGLICHSAQRPSALANLTVEEFEQGIMDEKSGLYVTQTAKHKTASTQGDALIYWNEHNLHLGHQYLTKVHPLVTTSDTSLLPSIPGITAERHAFFVTYTGVYMTGRQMSNRINEAVRRSFPDIMGTISSSHLRKSVVSSHRSNPGAAVSSEDLAAQMTHAVNTANKHYYLDDVMKRN